MQDFRTVMAQRTLDWEGCVNVRDLGGLPLPDGSTRWGTVIRAEFPGHLTAQGWKAVIQANVTSMIDLRAPQEVEKEPYTIPQGSKIRWLNLPMEAFLPEVSALISKAQNRAEVYTIILDHYPDCIAQVLRSVIAVQDGAVLIHCQSGTDRTGTIAALILDLAGVPLDWIAADYAESQVRLASRYEKKQEEAVMDENLGFWSRPTATADMMTAMLEHIHQTYHSTEEYMRFAGLSEDEIAALRHKI